MFLELGYQRGQATPEDDGRIVNREIRIRRSRVFRPYAARFFEAAAIIWESNLYGGQIKTNALTDGEDTSGNLLCGDSTNSRGVEREGASHA